MKNYAVMYRDTFHKPHEEPFVFECWADDEDHAMEQCFNAYPACEIVAVNQTNKQMMVTVYFEEHGTGYSEVVATFATEEIYMACLPALKEKANQVRMAVTESINYGDEE